MRRPAFAMALVLALGITVVPMQTARAGGGLLGVDHRLHYDNSGIWKRGNQTALIYGTIASVGVGALAFGDHSKLGDTFWRSVDALVLTSVATTDEVHVPARTPLTD